MYGVCCGLVNVQDVNKQIQIKVARPNQIHILCDTSVCGEYF